MASVAIVATMTKPLDHFQSKRGRPSATQTQAINVAILKTARRKFLEEGYDSVAMEQVAAEAGVSKGTLYARHPSKEVLFNAVVDSAIVQWSEESSRNDHLLTDDIRQRLQYHAISIIRSLQRPDVTAFRRLMMANRDRFPGLSEAMLDRGFRYIVALIAGDLETWAERQGKSCQNAESVSVMLVSAITGLDMQDPDVLGKGLEDFEAYTLRCVDLILAARDAW